MNLTLLQILAMIDELAVLDAEQRQEKVHSIIASVSTLDIGSAVDRVMRIAGYGFLIGLPSQPGASSTATTGVPTNAIAGFAKGALFINYKGSVGSLLYVNTGSNTSATWTNVV